MANQIRTIAEKVVRWCRLKALIERIGRLLFGDDAFGHIEEDGSTYALALVRQLSKYHCYLDPMGTVPGRELPKGLRGKYVEAQFLFSLRHRQLLVPHRSKKRLRNFSKPDDQSSQSVFQVD